MQDAGKKQVAAVMAIQAARAATVPRPFMRLRPQQLTVQMPSIEGEAEARAIKLLGLNAKLE